MFTSAEASRIRQALGYADLCRYLNPRLESVLSSDVVSADTEALVRTSLASLDAVDAQILGTALPGAGVARVDDVAFFKGRTKSELIEYGQMYINRVSVSLGVPIAADYFASDGYPGDTFSSLGGPVNTGRGTFGLG